jgi:hypothetical protein
MMTKKSRAVQRQTISDHDQCCLVSLILSDRELHNETLFPRTSNLPPLLHMAPDLNSKYWLSIRLRCLGAPAPGPKQLFKPGNDEPSFLYGKLTGSSALVTVGVVEGFHQPL